MIHLLTCVMYQKEYLPTTEGPIPFPWYALLCEYASPLVSWWSSGWGG